MIEWRGIIKKKATRYAYSRIYIHEYLTTEDRPIVQPQEDTNTDDIELSTDSTKRNSIYDFDDNDKDKDKDKVRRYYMQ